MARVVKKPVYGSFSSCAGRLRMKSGTVFEDSQSESSSLSSHSSIECSPRRRDDFVRYEDSDDEDYSSSPTHCQVSHNFVDLVSQRMLGFDKQNLIPVNPEYGTRHLLSNNNFRENTINLGEMNKIFCSWWLNSRQVVFGSKCNTLSVYDISKREIFSIPLLKSFHKRRPPENQCGIHSIAVNPSETILATGAENTNEIAFYRLPTFDPLAVGEGAHNDWMFDLQWLDDFFVVSGSRDTNMALWRIDDGENDHNKVVRLKPVAVKRCRTAEKVRALSVGKKEMEIAALSLNGYIHVWKADCFKQINSQKLQHGIENVCMTYQEEHNIYAVGSRAHTTILDARSLQPIQNKNIVSVYPICGVRSLSFRGDILTIGTGAGAILFYDVRATKFMNYNEKSGEIVFKTTCSGWMETDETPPQYNHNRYPPAVYTHCYDANGTRLFAAGGPLAVGRQGHYAAVWS